MANTYEELMAKSRELHAAGDIDGARRLAKIAIGRRQSPEMTAGLQELSALSQNPQMPPQNTVAGTVKQFGAGSQSGIAAGLGFPVDAVTSAMNGVGQFTGMWNPIENPIGGSASLSNLMEPFRAGIPEPQTATERGARRIGQEVGASAAMFPAAFASSAVRAAPALSAAVESVSAIGSGTGGAVANELAPGSATADIIGSMMGGLPTGRAASRIAGLIGSKNTVINGMDDQRQRAADAYGAVRADQRILPQDGVDNMALGISGKMDAERMYPPVHPGSSNIHDLILRDSSTPMRIEDVENLRRMTTQGLPATAAPADRRLAGLMKDDITSYLDGLNDPVANGLKDGRDAHRRVSAAQAVADASTKASRRAARTGSGGNEINALRQNLSSIIDNPRKAASFTASERSAIDDIVRGTTEQNAMRRASRFAPSSGGLSAMMGIGGAMAAPQAALPIMAITEAAKYLGERSTRKSIAELLQSLAPDKITKVGDEGIGGILRAMLAARTVARQ